MAIDAASLRSGRLARVVPRPVAVACVGLLVAAAAAAAESGEANARPPYAIALDVATGVSFLLVGAVAAWHRPHNRTGLLMVGVGLAWFIPELKDAPSSLAVTVGEMFNVLAYGVLAHLVLAFPSGRLGQRRERLVVKAVYAWTILGQILTQSLFAAAAGSGYGPHDLLVINRSAEQHVVAGQVQNAVNIAMFLLAFLIVVEHWRSASRPARRALSPAMWSSGPILTVLVALNILSLLTQLKGLNVLLSNVLKPLALMSLPVAFLVGMLRTSFSRLAVGHLVVDLRENPPPDRLRDVLARSVRDPSLIVAYRVPGHADWVDASGSPVTMPGEGSTRAVTYLERGGVSVAALIHDRALEENPTLIASVAAAASLALDNERLAAEVKAQLMEVRASRARIVAAADAERRRVQRDLHDGAQQRLVALGMQLGRLCEGMDSGSDPALRQRLEQASQQLRIAIGELRELSHGIHPAILVEAGLGPALQSLADGAPVPVRIEAVPERRLPDRVEAAAFFVVSESLANVAKHARAGAVTVSARCKESWLIVTVEDDGAGGADQRRGSGLSGLRDRVAALDGRLVIDSSAEAGTRVVAELPCA